MSTGRMV